MRISIFWFQENFQFVKIELCGSAFFDYISELRGQIVWKSPDSWFSDNVDSVLKKSHHFFLILKKVRSFLKTNKFFSRYFCTFPGDLRSEHDICGLEIIHKTSVDSHIKHKMIYNPEFDVFA